MGSLLDRIIQYSNLDSYRLVIGSYRLVIDSYRIVIVIVYRHRLLGKDLSSKDALQPTSSINFECFSFIGFSLLEYRVYR